MDCLLKSKIQEFVKEIKRQADMAEAQAVMKTTSGDGDQLRNLQERSEGAIPTFYRDSINNCDKPTIKLRTRLRYYEK